MGITVTSTETGYIASNLPDQIYDSRENAGKAAGQYAKTRTIREIGLVRQQAVLDSNRFEHGLERQSTGETARPEASCSRQDETAGSDFRSYILARLESREKKRGWEICYLTSTVDFVIEWAENLHATTKRKSKDKGDALTFDVRRDYAVAALKYLQHALENGKDVQPASLKTMGFGGDLSNLGRTELQRVSKFRDYCLWAR